MSVVNKDAISRFGIWPKAIAIIAQAMPSEARRKEREKTLVVSHPEGTNMGASEIARFGSDLKILDNRIEIINYMLGFGVVNGIGNPLMMSIRKGEYRIMVGDCEMDSFRIYDYMGAEDAIKRIDGLNDGLWYMLGKWLSPINTT